MTLKTLYGVQATGNGHISKARVLVPALRERGAEVHSLFSGRDPAQLFDMDVFNPYETRTGLTFAVHNGKVSPLRTAFQKSIGTLVKNVLKLDLKNYDLLVTDYEPVTSWAAKRAHRDITGMGHQYAFYYDLPGMPRKSIFSHAIRAYTPVTSALGLHWDSFGQSILPPMIETPEPREADPRKIVVYMNFEKPENIAKMVSPFAGYRFHIYSPQIKEQREQGNVIFKRLSREGFQRDLSDCVGAISNAGFEFPAEMMQMGKKILVKPQDGQQEQASNGHILAHLGYGDMMKTLDQNAVARWLDKKETVQIKFPNTGAAIADWLVASPRPPVEELSAKLWQQTIITPKMTPG